MNERTSGESPCSGSSAQMACLHPSISFILGTPVDGVVLEKHQRPVDGRGVGRYDPTRPRQASPNLLRNRLASGSVWALQPQGYSAFVHLPALLDPPPHP